MNCRKLLLVVAAGLLLAPQARSAEVSDAERRAAHLVNPLDFTVPLAYTNAAGKVLLYRWMTPTMMHPAHPKINPAKKYPLVVYLHGAGSRGNDNASQVCPQGVGVADIIGYWRSVGGQVFLIAGQVPVGMQWVDTPWNGPAHVMPKKPSLMMGLLEELLEKTFAEQPIDRDRVYVTGLSMGGFGTWDIVQRHPDWFAAALPICGGGDTTLAWKIRDIPIWAAHGDGDPIVPPRRTRDMVAALWAIGGNIRYREYNGYQHNVWEPMYADWNGVLKWFFLQRRRHD